jgi:hypothetical protein
MAKKSAARKKTAARTPAPKRAVKAAARSKKAPAKKAPARKAAPAARTPVRKAAKKAARKVMKKAAPARKTAPKKATARKVVAKKAPARKVAAKPAVVRKPAPKAKVAPKVAPKAPVKAAAPKRAAKAPATRKAAPAPARHVATINRERRTVAEPTPSAPSSLVANRHASAASSGADELRVRLASHTGTGPAITAGDVDANWEAAETVGDEAPGGDNPTPDQDVVDEIGKALGVEYNDDEELQGGDEIAARDHDRWELDPASSDDFDER